MHHSPWQGYDKGQDHTVNKHPVHTFRFSHTIILTGKAHAGLGNRIHGHIQKSKNIIGCCISCHSNGTKGVYRRLKKYIGKLITVLWIPAGSPTWKICFRYSPFMDSFENAADSFPLSDTDTEGQECRRSAERSPFRFPHRPRLNDTRSRKQIQKRIGTAGNDQKDQRPLGISHSTQDRRTIVIQHKNGIPRK